MPVERRGDAWEVTVNWRGARYRRSSRHWTRAQASEVERTLLNELHAQSIGKQPERSFYEAVEKWRNEYLPAITDQKREKAHLKALAPFMQGKNLKDAQEVAAEAKKAWQSLAPATVNRRLAIMRRIVNLAYDEWGWLEQPLGQKISLLPNKRQRHVYATPKQVEKLAAACPRSGGYILLAAYTGIRRGQLLRLTASQVQGGCLNLGTDGKTGQPQLVPLHRRVKAIAHRLPLCSPQILRDEWEDARKEAGLTHLRFHDLRHTAASWLLQSGASLKHVADLLGHSDMRMAQRYAHLQVADLRRAISKMPATQMPQKKARRVSA